MMAILKDISNCRYLINIIFLYLVEYDRIYNYLMKAIIENYFGRMKMCFLKAYIPNMFSILGEGKYFFQNDTKFLKCLKRENKTFYLLSLNISLFHFRFVKMVRFIYQQVLKIGS